MDPATNEAGVIPDTNKITPQVKEDLKSFQPASVNTFAASAVNDTAQANSMQASVSEFFDIQKEDYSWKVHARKFYGRLLMILLFLQNAFVFTLIIIALFANKLTELQMIFSIIIPATLGETAFMVNVIIQWMFKDIQYPTR